MNSLHILCNGTLTISTPSKNGSCSIKVGLVCHSFGSVCHIFFRNPFILRTFMPCGHPLYGIFLGPYFFANMGGLVAWFARIDSHDSRESGDSRESEIRVIRAKWPDAHRGFICEWFARIALRIARATKMGGGGVQNCFHKRCDFQSSLKISKKLQKWANITIFEATFASKKTMIWGYF